MTNTYEWKITTRRMPIYRANGQTFKDVISSMRGVLIVSDGINMDDSVTYDVSIQPPTSQEGFVAEQDLTYDDIVKMFEEAMGPAMLALIKANADRSLEQNYPPVAEEGQTYEPPKKDA